LKITARKLILLACIFGECSGQIAFAQKQITAGLDLSGLNAKATYYCARGRYLEAEPYVKQTLAPSMVGEVIVSPLITATQFFSLGGIEFGLRNYKSSQAAYAQALNICLHSYTSDGEKLVGDIYRQRASVALELANLTEANTYYHKALQVHSKLFGKSNPEVAFDLLGLGTTYARQQAFSQAESVIKQNVAMTEQAFGKEAPQLVASCETMSSILKQTNRLAEAKQWEKRGQEIRSRHSPWNQERLKSIVDRQYWIFPENPFFPTFN
jgi:tetratricopeptide (TPR) repeat protein